MTFETASIVATAAILVSMCIVLVRLFLGPSLYDRVMAVNSFGTKTVLLLAVMNFLMGRPDFIDLALLYALINFAGTIAVLKFFRYRSFNVPLSSLSGDSVPDDLKVRMGDGDNAELETKEGAR